MWSSEEANPFVHAADAITPEPRWLTVHADAVVLNHDLERAAFERNDNGRSGVPGVFANVAE
jgi:hypothetical protein